MARSDLDKFRLRLALVDYFRDAFGVEDTTDYATVRRFYDELNQVNEGYNSEGRSYVYNFISAKADEEKLSQDDLLRYDENIKQHVEKINERRAVPVVLKPFQVLAGLISEAYLDRSMGEPEVFLNRLNAFVDEYNDEHKGQIKYPKFSKENLNTAAFWMATGSGKTLLMHLNYYQYLHYAEEHDETPDNILLVTPNEGLSQQHIDKFRESSIPCRQFNAESINLWGAGENPVKVIEIQKLTEEKTGEGLSVEVDSFEGQNLVMVDEGHKGAGSTAQSWRNRREALASDGFTFEYSATFGQAVAGASASIEEEYGKTILFDYSYPRFYDDGYGKDYRILNLENDVDDELRDRYLLANLLTFFEQIYVYNQDSEAFHGRYNIRNPLLVFIGHSVNAEKTQSGLSSNDKRSLSDVEDVLLFVGRVLQNQDGWVPDAIGAILANESGLEVDEGVDLFAESFDALRDSGLSGSDVYQQILDRIFQTESSSGLEIVNISNATGEIGLRARSTDNYFGVINIGNDRVFLDRVEKHDLITVEEDQFADSLFSEIDKNDSNVNILLGSRKFIEGWDSWRVSTMGLMNFGRGEGPQIIQLFGRGVRLLGKNQTLKRSRELPGDHPDNIETLETLNIFGVRADYMADFRDYLSEEGIDTEERETIEIETQIQDHFQGEGLLVARPEIEGSFEEQNSLWLETSDEFSPEIDLAPRLGVISSRSEYEGSSDAEKQSIPNAAIEFLDWHRIYRDIWQFRTNRGYRNQVVEKSKLKEIVSEGHYTLRCPEDLVAFDSFDDLDRIREIVLMILRKYIEQQYRRAEKVWEQSSLTYTPIEDEIGTDNGVMIASYSAEVKASAEDFIKQLESTLEDGVYSDESGVPNRVRYDQHLYLPLIAEESGQNADDVNYSPPALNAGEEAVVRDIKQYFDQNDGQAILDEWKVYLLRNQSRGRGIGFLVGDRGAQRFFPDFILWLKNENHQHIVFLEPHGLALEGDPLANHRVTFHEEIKEYEEELSERTDRNDVSLHSYLISQSDLQELKDRSRVDDRNGFHENGIYFPEDGIGTILDNVLD
ncbi:DEAD/DEAH box helicase family protein [Halococcus thailandensis]|uniref:Helicase ATP-binding domain-containing protein n=1 Tax=Halococcus thailandensis JCM 13552 TaxID=1227457 RepID=M0NCR4_9EURY|nr:DEAD/DEAH box helicase family protein [Halococcus thailandensis]EMA54879.1 hypothetical protein C451_05910 [Halococcus thailandensis JCM 13552]